jgi:hypothetical protein
MCQHHSLPEHPQVSQLLIAFHIFFAFSSQVFVIFSLRFLGKTLDRLKISHLFMPIYQNIFSSNLEEKREGSSEILINA